MLFLPSIGAEPAGRLLRWTRLSEILTAWAVLLYFLQRRYGLLRRFLDEKSSSVNLGMARIVIMLTLYWQVSLSRIERFAGLDHALLVPFLGWGRLAVRLPHSHHTIIAVYACFVIATGLALVGFRARSTSVITGLCSFYLLCIPQLAGKVDHDVGHLAMFPFILALAPSGDALSVDAFLQGKRLQDPGFWLRPRYARVYATALQAMMLYIGLAYFFPGLWKLVAFGTGWFHPAHLQYLITEMWAEIGMTPFQFWFLRHPFLLFLGATATIVFELGFLLAVLSPKARPYLILVGISFHNFTLLLMGISFGGLQPMYLLLLDWSPLFARLAAKRPPLAPSSTQADRAPTRSTLLLRAFCVLALAGMVITGALRKMFTWPMDCYPTFDWPLSPTIEIRSLQAVDAQGISHMWKLSYDPVMRAQYGNEHWKDMVWYDFGASPEDHARTRAALRLWTANHPSPPLVRGRVVESTYLRTPLMDHLQFVSSRTVEDLSAEDFGQK